MVDTEAPTTIVGPYPNYYNQRVRSWDMAEHAYAYEFFRVLFFTRHKTLTGTLVLKWFQFYSCYSVVADWIRIPVMSLTIWVNWTFFVAVSSFFLILYTTLTIVWDYLGYRKCPERRSRLTALLTFQIYKIPSIFIRLLGMGRAFFVYLPNYKPKPTIPELEAEYRVIAAQQVAMKQQQEAETCDVAAGVVKFPVWLDKTSKYYEHYDPRNPTRTGMHETEPDVPEERVALPGQLYRVHDPDSDSVTTLTVDDALRDQDFFLGPLSSSIRKAKKRRKRSRQRKGSHLEEEQELSETEIDDELPSIDEDMPSIEEDYECAPQILHKIPLKDLSANRIFSGDEGGSFRDTWARPSKPLLSVVHEESAEVSTEPSRGGTRSRETAGQETSDNSNSSGALTSALGGQKTFADSSISTHTTPAIKGTTNAQPTAESSSHTPLLKLPVVDAVPGGDLVDM